jgi:hypothetical protein
MSAMSDLSMQPVTLSLGTLVHLLETALVCGDDRTEFFAQLVDHWLSDDVDPDDRPALRLLDVFMDGDDAGDVRSALDSLIAHQKDCVRA